MFTGLRVLELASVLAGPSVGQFFAELGAEVVKVENPNTGGDVTRSWKTAGEKTDDRSAYFCSCNWGKKSIALDLTLAGDLEVVKKLSSRADIIIASYKPGDAEKLGVSYAQLKKLNPKLIYGEITGYGGADDDRVGYDAVIQAESGFMDLNGEKNGPPTKMPVALIDVLAGHQLKEGLLLALLNRERTGFGDLVQVSLVQTAVASLVNQATNWLVGGKLPARQGSAHPNIAPYGESFVTKEGKRILLAVGSDKQFEALKQILGITDEESFAYVENKSRVANREALNRVIAEKMLQVNASELMQKLNKQKIPAGFIQNMKEVFEMPAAKEIQLQQNGLIGVKSFIAKAARDGNGDSRIPPPSHELLPPPHLGEHAKEILSSLQN